MSTYTEISRLIAARGRIRDKLTALGLATAQDKLDTLAGALDGVADCGAVEKNLREGETYQIPAGYHNGAGRVVGVSGGGSYDLQQKQATPDLQARYPRRGLLRPVRRDGGGHPGKLWRRIRRNRRGG